MDASLPVLCGSVSTVMFVVGTLPMLLKAARTRDLASYSLGNIALSNAGNAVNTVYVVSLPIGPVWFLHGFNVATTALMLFWYLRYTGRVRRGAGGVAGRRGRDAAGRSRDRSGSAGPGSEWESIVTGLSEESDRDRDARHLLDAR